MTQGAARVGRRLVVAVLLVHGRLAEERRIAGGLDEERLAE